LAQPHPGRATFAVDRTSSAWAQLAVRLSFTPSPPDGMAVASLSGQETDTMNDSTQAKPIHQESTYQMLVAAEEKERNVIEDIVYLLLVIATTVTIFQFSREPVKFGDLGLAQAERIAAMM
jgi:hypothetical protein